MKILLHDPYLVNKSDHEGGGGIPKNIITWFINGPYIKKENPVVIQYNDQETGSHIYRYK